MKNSKPWYTSKTIWGSLIAIFAGIASAFGFDIDAGQQADLVDALLKVAATAGSLLAIYGRFAANSSIL